MDLQILSALGLSVGVGAVIIVCGLLAWDWLSWLWGNITSRTRMGTSRTAARGMGRNPLFDLGSCVAGLSPEVSREVSETVATPVATLRPVPPSRSTPAPVATPHTPAGSPSSTSGRMIR